MSMSEKKKNAARNAYIRAGIQVIFFLSMPGMFMAAFSGIKNIFQRISEGSVLELNGFVLTLVALSAFTIVFGRFFCGFACAFGSLGDFVYWLSGIIQTKVFKKKKQYTLPEKIILPAQKIKYVLLAIIVVTCALGLYQQAGVYNWNPWTVFSFLVSLSFDIKGYYIGAALLVLLIVGMATQERFFCQFLCPMGAVFALLPQMPFSALQRDEENCIKGCSACKRKCPVNIKLEQDGFYNGECIACEKCAGICPKDNLTRWDRKLFGKAWITVLIKAGLLLSLGVLTGNCRW